MARGTSMPMAALLAIILLVLVLLAIWHSVLSPIDVQKTFLQNQSKVSLLCSNWSAELIPCESEPTDEMKSVLGCEDKESCREVCSLYGFC